MRSASLLALILAACGPSRPAAGPATPAPAAAPAAAPAPPRTEPDDEPAADAAVVAAIEQAVNDTRAARHACWARAAADDYRLAGRVALRVAFGQHGSSTAIEVPTTVPTVTVLDDQPRDQVLTRCLVALYQGYAWPAVFAPGTAIELPFAFAAPRYQYTVQAEDVDPLDGNEQVQTRLLLHEQNTGNDDLVLALVTVAPAAAAGPAGLESRIPADATALVYVLEGQVELTAGPGRGDRVRIAAGQALALAAGVVPAVRALGDAPARLVQIFAAPAADGAAPADGAAAPPRAGQARRARRPRVQARPQRFAIAGGQAEVGIFYDRAGGHEAASLATLTAQPGLRIPAHAHERETEMVLVLDGRGTMTIDGETHPIAPMTAIQIPPGVEHAVVCEGDAPLRALQVYTPSGPEQRFKQPPTPESQP